MTTATPKLSRSTEGPWLTLILGVLIGFGPLSIDMYLPAFPAIGESLHATAGEVERTLATFFAGLAVGQLFAGPVSDRFGRTKPLYVGLLLYVVGSIGCATAPSADILAACRFVQALGGSVGMVTTRAVVRDLHSGAAAARMMSRLVLVMGLAPILAPLLGGWVLRAAGWRAIFASHAVIGLIALGAVLAILPETAPPRSGSTPSKPFQTLWGITKAPDFLGHALAAGLAQAGMFAYIGGSPFVFITLHGVKPEHFGWFFGANAAGLVAMSQINHWLLARSSPARVLKQAVRVATLAGLALVAVASTGFGGLWGIALSLFVFVSSLGAITPNATALAMEHHAKQAGIASAVLGALQFMLAAGASAAVSASHDGTARPMALGVAIAALLALGALNLAERAPAH
ncbi:MULTISPECIES: multidrug effflux MFS transporter [unclassified Corallococcus]|uniref:multidrug effflux MFS transporter n=1 Tax=unclassified Corallococcus TaxID=2685029 RepID=UPI001A906EFA|nr:MULTISPECIES: multidrug effflux MFS transporter [unclassified Corallococcus]MBN9681603.1 multidrug effflux MFS transporter [Corallococcus sp. NCSPR001]WAS86823.1 multidrug effflux MFS transporter [Corallococcus sp. NCRR]